MDYKEYLHNYYVNNKQKLSKSKSEWYFKNRARLLAKNALYVKENKDKINARRRQRTNGIALLGSSKSIESPFPEHKKYSEKEKQSVRRKLRHAIDKGVLVRLPCEVCANPKTDAHHDDYTKPLEVKWFCRQHHKDLHRNVLKVNE